jgi:predicted kinase
VVLDATFQKKSYRDMAKQIAKDHDAQLVIIECVAPESIVKKWLKQRLHEKTVSDGRWEIYQEQKKVFEAFSPYENRIVFDMSERNYNIIFDKFNEIINLISTL